MTACAWANSKGIVGEEDGYSAESDAAILLQGLDIADELHERKMSELQGGQKVRVLLAQALFGHPQALLLDEPTNHLDLDSIHWLREFLIRYDGTLIVISHDRHFLNWRDARTRPTSTIRRSSPTPAATTTWWWPRRRSARRSKRRTPSARRRSRSCNDFIARFSAGTRSSQVQSRRKEVERLQTNDLARSNIQRPYIRFQMNAAVGQARARVQQRVARPTTARRVIDGLQRGHQPRRKNRAGRAQWRGQNHAAQGAAVRGARSAALTRATTTRVQMRWGHEVSVGYFAQDHTGRHPQGHDGGRVAAPVRSRRLAAGHSRPARADALHAARKGTSRPTRFRAAKPRACSSAASCCRSRTCWCFDEPTNHLDLESINALNIALQKYEGTVLLVTHDQDLIEEVGTPHLALRRHGIEDFKGPYEELVGTGRTQA